MQIKLLAVMGSDLTVVNCARVSFGKESSALNERDINLIHHLARNNHWSPFAHPQLHLFFNIPIAIARQFDRHTVGVTKSEISRRYTKQDIAVYPVSEFRKKDPDIKQGSSAEIIADNERIVALYNRHITESLERYAQMIAAGVCYEQARFVLPQSTYTQIRVTLSLYSAIRIIKLRIDSHAQQEIQIIAQQLADIVQEKFPISYQAFFKRAQSA